LDVLWLTTNFKQNHFILTADIGGTNTRIALVGKKNSKITILLKLMFKSSEINGLIDPFKQLLQIARQKNSSLVPEFISISAAGLVENNYCTLINCSWNIDAKKIQKVLGIKTYLFNDFSAICYGINTLDIKNPDHITCIPHSDGSHPESNGKTKAVVGAGTGLGMGLIISSKDRDVICPSEGGHSSFSPFDEETTKLYQFLTKEYGTAPGNEAFVSGRGIVNIYNYETKKTNQNTGYF